MKNNRVVPMDHDQNAIEELLKHLDGVDGAEMHSAMNPKKGVGVEVTKVEGLGDGTEDPSVDASAMVDGEGGAAGDLTPEQLEEIIEALQSKIGA